ncbi:Verru_Chthon cassette protein D [Prosthecobacter sp.]|uniref:Verru_Chthon cassette protein D n=1 Tax=Prosthecobacter sp. TaxID=1965333 RepID=UPI001DE7EB5A|nr:Verru_Chthon cassette protein D [Prosthecobacter sp.]MCB1275003.1 Verru_Chthon cassette protein D [Prosthecobacter sp.]
MNPLALSHRRQVRASAFTLIEMLVVITIIVLLLAFSTPALMRTMQASKLASAGDSLMGAISEAQQIAFAQNLPVEMRFFKFAEGMETEKNFHSYQSFKVTENFKADGTVEEKLVPVNNLARLPDSVIVVPDVSLSPILSSGGQDFEDERDGTSNGYSGVNGARYNALRFMPDGSCRSVGTTTGGLATLSFSTLPQSFLTVTTESGQAVKVENLPKNFYTIQIDPFTGKARSYKPGF